jgi:ribonuclease D
MRDQVGPLQGVRLRLSYTLIDDAARAAGLGAELRGEARVALDCEAAGFHRYSDRLCLLQLSTARANYIFDTLAFNPSKVLAPVLETPQVEVVLHGADYDLRLLDRDLGLHPRGIFDTQIAAALSGEESLGLASLLERHLGVVVSKKHQRADWARRPLPSDMLEYASSDTRHLLALADILKARLAELGRSEWAREEFVAMEQIRWEGQDSDPVLRVRGARELAQRELALLREALLWRDGVAREKDRAPFRVAGDQPLLELVRRRPRNLSELGQLVGINPSLVRSEGEALLERLRRVEELPDSALPPYPQRRANGRGRPPPEVEALGERLKEARNRRAQALGMDRGTLMANGVITEIAWVHPKTAAALGAVPGVKQWQMEAVGKDLLAVLVR